MKENKKEMKAIQMTFEQAGELHVFASDDMKVILEAQFPELKPKLITDVVKTVEDAHKYVLKENIPYHNNLYYTYQDGVSNNSHAGILRLAHVINEDWVADFNNLEQEKFTIVYNAKKQDFEILTLTYIQSADIPFRSHAIASHALLHNQQLFKDIFKVK